MEISRKIIARNVKHLRFAIGLSQLKFANLVGLSKPTIINIEGAKRSYTLDLLDKISEFSGYSLSELSRDGFQPNENIREVLAERYRGNTAYIALDEKPEIVYAIRQKLLKSDFLADPKEIKEIKKYFEGLGWYFKGTSISNSLKRMSDLIESKKHETKKNTNVYRKR